MNTLTFLESRGLFSNYLAESTKDSMRGILHQEVEEFKVEDEELDQLFDKVDDLLLKHVYYKFDDSHYPQGSSEISPKNGTTSS